MYSKHMQGALSELKAAAYFTSNNYIVSKPLTEVNEYDLIIDNGKLYKVQVKTAYWDVNKSRHLISCVTSHIRGNGRRHNKKYTKDSFDLLCAVVPNDLGIYVIPIEKIINRRGLTVYPKGKPSTINSRYNDFEKFKVY